MNPVRRKYAAVIRGFRVTVAVAAAALVLSGASRAELPRRIAVSVEPRYYMLDSEFFGLSDAFGVNAALRYELANDIYFENGIGFFSTEGGGVDVTGLDWQLNFLALFPVLIPYRPVARLGIGVMSVNPVTVTPTDTFRPTQTTFYFLGGAGVTRSILDNVLLEASAAFWVTPYEYRIYSFNRLDVTTTDVRFTHLSIAIGLVYTF
jgi:hypothetical protein